MAAYDLKMYSQGSGGILENLDAHPAVERVAEMIRRALEDTDLRNRLRGRGLARAAQLSWEHCTRETMRIFAETSASYGR